MYPSILDLSLNLMASPSFFICSLEPHAKNEIFVFLRIPCDKLCDTPQFFNFSISTPPDLRYFKCYKKSGQCYHKWYNITESYLNLQFSLSLQVLTQAKSNMSCYSHGGYHWISTRSSWHTAGICNINIWSFKKFTFGITSTVLWTFS